MLTIKLRIVVAVCVILSLAVIINIVRKKQLELKYALSWLGVACAILVLDCFPELLDKISVLLGIASPVNTLFFCGFVFSLVIMFTLTIAVSRLSIRVKDIAQEVALYEKKERHSDLED